MVSLFLKCSIQTFILVLDQHEKERNSFNLNKLSVLANRNALFRKVSLGQEKGDIFKMIDYHLNEHIFNLISSISLFFLFADMLWC